MEEERFEPNAEELVSFYLKNKILGIGSEFEFIVDTEMYGDDKTPWEAFNFEGNQLPWLSVVDQFGVCHNSSQSLYVFTRLRNVGKRGKKQKVRAAGIGTWHNDRSGPVYNSQDQLIGNCKVFTFVPDQEVETLGLWTMNEYTIEPSAHPELSGIDCDNLVVCMIKRDDSKSCKGKGGKRACKRPRSESSEQPKKKSRLINDHTPVQQGSEDEPVSEIEPLNVTGCLNDDWVGDILEQYQGSFREDLSNPNLWFDSSQLLTCGVG